VHFGQNFEGLNICKTMQCHFIYIYLFYLFYFFKVKELNLEILPNDKRHTFFCVLFQFCLIIPKIKAKFLIGENKHVCGYYKIICIPNPKCNTHM
jgi:hypothetical protein